MSDDRRKSGGGLWNGFETIPEETALKCDPKLVRPHTLPQEALIFVPSQEDSVCLFKNGDKERKIHNNIELDDQEKEALANLQKEAKAQGLQFLPSITAMATRFLSRARGDPAKAVALMQATQAWRLEYFGSGPISDDQVREDLKYGIVYFTGRDSSLRPTIVVRPRRIPQEWYRLKCIDRMIKCLIFVMEYMLWYMLIPGRIENTNVIVDLKDLGLTQLPLGALKDIYGIMSHHYIGRVFRFYVVNLSWVLNTISGAVKAILTDRQKQKLMMLNDVKELRESFAMHQLEEDLGGSRPIDKEFFPFELPPGPFTAGSTAGPNKAAVGGGHDLLSESKAARQGVLWDPAKPAKENTKLIYSADAYKLFEKCGYPIPPDCPMPKTSPEPPVVPEKGTEEAVPTNGTTNGITNGNTQKRMSQREMRSSLRDLGIVSVDMSLPEGVEPVFSDEENGTCEKPTEPKKLNDVFADSLPNGNGTNGTKTTTPDLVLPVEPVLKIPSSTDAKQFCDTNGDEKEYASSDAKNFENEGNQVSPASWWWCSSCRVTSNN